VDFLDCGFSWSLENWNRRQAASFVLLAFLLSGFLWAVLINRTDYGVNFTTQARCPCDGVYLENNTDELNESFTGKIECNSGTKTRYLYNIGVFWASHTCSATEVNVCRSGMKTDSYYRAESCSSEVETGNIVKYLATHELG
jgi:hypothetical protein